LLIQQEFEGNIIEPKYFIPIIPMLLVNGSIGLTTGFSQKILPRDPKELIKWITCKLTNKKFTGKLLPYFKNFKGMINKISNDVYDIVGKYEKISANKIEITDIPCGPGTGGYSDLNSYLAILDKLVDDKKIKDYDDYSEANEYKIVVTFYRNQGLDIDTCDIVKELKLSKTVTENYTSLNADNKVVEYNSIEEILEEYYNVRFAYYEKRKELIIKKLSDKILLDVSKYTFIKGVIDEEIILKNKSYEQIEKQLSKIKNIIKYNDSYDYLLNMSMISITKERYMKLKETLKELKTELVKIKSTTPEEMWQNDLTEFLKYFK
jgi:DNA topoisomerase-2